MNLTVQEPLGHPLVVGVSIGHEFLLDALEKGLKWSSSLQTFLSKWS